MRYESLRLTSFFILIAGLVRWLLTSTFNHRIAVSIIFNAHRPLLSSLDYLEKPSRPSCHVYLLSGPCFIAWPSLDTVDGAQVLSQSFPFRRWTVLMVVDILSHLMRVLNGRRSSSFSSDRRARPTKLSWPNALQAWFLPQSHQDWPTAVRACPCLVNCPRTFLASHLIISIILSTHADTLSYLGRVLKHSMALPVLVLIRSYPPCWEPQRRLRWSGTVALVCLWLWCNAKSKEERGPT